MEEHKFEYFENVLVRHCKSQKWCLAQFSHYDKDCPNYPFFVLGGCSYACCIPFEGNERLLGKKDDYEKPEPLYIPKDGDIVVDGWEQDGLKCEWIALVRNVNEFSNGFYDTHFDMFTIKAVKEEEDYRFGGRCRKFDKFRLATEEERQLLFSKLAELGMRWNPEKKKIVGWEPIDGEEFWYISATMEVHQAIYMTENHRLLNLAGNRFRTEAEALAMAEKFQKILNSKKDE